MISEEIAENEKIEVDTSRQRKRHKKRHKKDIKKTKIKEKFLFCAHCIYYLSAYYLLNLENKAQQHS